MRLALLTFVALFLWPLLLLAACGSQNDSSSSVDAGFVLDLRAATVAFPSDYIECDEIDDSPEGAAQHVVCDEDDPSVPEFLIADFTAGAFHPYDFKGKSPEELAVVIDADLRAQYPDASTSADLLPAPDGQPGVLGSMESGDLSRLTYWVPMDDGGLVLIASNASSEYVSFDEHRALFLAVQGSLRSR